MYTTPLVASLFSTLTSQEAVDEFMDVDFFEPQAVSKVFKNAPPIPVDLERDFAQYLGLIQYEYPPHARVEPDSTRETKADNPRMLVEGMASHCSLLVSCDKDGNAVTGHFDFVMPQNDPPEEMIGQFGRRVADVVCTDRVGVVTATQRRARFDQPNPEVAQFVQDQLQQTVSMHSLLMNEDFLNRGIGFIHGIAFIPKQLTVDSRNKLFLICAHDDRPQDEDALRDLMRIEA